LAGVSHDLRTPMARMRLAVELLGDGVDPKLVARFERNLEVMDELVGDALKFARGTVEPAQPLLLRGYLEEIVEEIDESVDVDWHGGPELAFAAAPGALRRVLQNLVSNALQHGRGQVHVVADVADSVEVHVVDSGPGIPEEYRDEVFQPFFRLDRSRSQATGGSGLGLAIVHQLCQAQGWKVEIRDAANGGADVVLNLGKVVG
jgi:two-component system osmolarity sensor histidine kinase EnvZ